MKIVKYFAIARILLRREGQEVDDKREDVSRAQPFKEQFKEQAFTDSSKTFLYLCTFVFANCVFRGKM